MLTLIRGTVSCYLLYNVTELKNCVSDVIRYPLKWSKKSNPLILRLLN